MEFPVKMPAVGQKIADQNTLMVVQAQRSRRNTDCRSSMLTAEFLLPANSGNARFVMSNQIMATLGMYIVIVIGTAGRQLL